MNATGFTESFSQAITAKNSTHPEAPLTLIFRAEHDPNGAFSGPRLEQLIWEISKIFVVSMKMISEASTFGKKIQEAQEEHGKPISLGIVAGHGNPNGIRLGISSYLTASDIRAEDFHPFTQDGRIILLSCSTGPFAQQIASISGVPVSAPVQRIPSNRFFFCHHENQVSFLYRSVKKENPAMYEFTQNNSPTPLSSDPVLLEKAYAEKVAYFRNHASVNGEEAADQLALAELLLEGTPAWQESCKEEILDHLKSAAALGSPIASHRLGTIYEQGQIGEEPSDEKAFNYYYESATREFPPGEHKISCLLRNKEGSGREAVYWLQRSANHGNPEAQREMNLLLKVKQVIALRERVADNGEADDQLALAVLLLEGDPTWKESCKEEILENLNLAAAQGSTEAVDRLEKIKKKNDWNGEISLETVCASASPPSKSEGSSK